MKYPLIIIGILIVGGIAYYGLSPLFRNVRMDEALPITTTSETSTTSGETFLSDPYPVEDTPAHPASGIVRIVKAGEKQYVRYENYKTINGPDIYVYLSKDLEAKDFLNLGKVKATEGNINYEIPTGVNIGEYKYVLTWCKTFGVLFNSAKIN